MFSFGPRCAKTCGQAGDSPEKGCKDDQRTGNLPCEERLREWSLFSLVKIRLRGNLITMFQSLKGGYKDVGDSLFARSPMEKMRGRGNNQPLE